MEYARKMVLIPSEQVDKINQQMQTITHSSLHNNNNIENAPIIPSIPGATTQTPGSNLGRLDSEMSQILFSPFPQDERERWKNYSQVLNKFLFFIEEDRKKQPIENTDNDSSESLPVDDIIATVPKSFRSQSSLLLKHLTKHGITNRIRWDKHGTVVIDGERIENSNITDLVNDAIRYRKSFNPPGRRHFARILQEIGTSRELVKNQEYWASSRQLQRDINNRSLLNQDGLITEDETSDEEARFQSLDNTIQSTRNRSRSRIRRDNGNKKGQSGSGMLTKWQSFILK